MKHTRDSSQALLRGNKGSDHESGILFKPVRDTRTTEMPVVMARRTARRRTLIAYTFCLTDMLATAADVLEVKLPDQAGEDSISLLPVLLGKPTTAPVRKAIFEQGDTDDNAIAICSGQWKANESTKAKNETVHQLYDLTKDPGETTDVAQKHPEVVKQLAGELAQARRDGRTRK